ncbi:MAG: ATP-binding cassette domain-containing protein [Candidatus Bruticola sp.]
MEPIIQLENVSFTYMDGTPFAKKALSGVSLSIFAGEAVGIVGATGSGKSTLIQHFNGLLRAESGIVKIKGVNIDRGVSGANLASVRFSVGLLFQFPEQQLFEETVFADVSFGPRNMGLAESEIEERAEEAIKLVGLDYIDYRHISPFLLSGGEKRRAALAGILSMRPDCLVLDEPTAGLDPRGTEEILSLLNKLKRRGNTIIMVSHRFSELAQICDRLVVMGSGKVLADGPLSKVLYSERSLREAKLEAPDICRICAYLQLGVSEGEYPVSVEEAVKFIERLRYSGI